MRIFNRSSLLVHAAMAGALLAAPALAQPSGNTVNAPAPGSTESYSGSLAELATGVRSTPEQPNTVQSPRDPASGQATGAVQPQGGSAAPQPGGYYNWPLEDIKVRNAANPPSEQTSGQTAGKRQYEPIMAGPGDGAGTPAQVQGGGNSFAGGTDDGSSIRRTNPNQTGAAGASAPGAAAANTANAIEVTNVEAGPPKPTAPTIGEPGSLRKGQRRQRPRTRKPAS